MHTLSKGFLVLFIYEATNMHKSCFHWLFRQKIYFEFRWLIGPLRVHPEPAASSVNATKDVVNYARFHLLWSRWYYYCKNAFLFATKVAKCKHIVWILLEHLN